MQNPVIPSKTFKNFGFSPPIFFAIFGRNLCGIVVAAMVFCATAPAMAAEIVGEISSLSGGLRIQRSDGQNLEEGFLGQKVFVGDRLETDGNGLVKLAFRDQSVVTLGPRSSLRMSEFVFLPDQQRREVMLKLYRGQCHVRVQPYPRWYSATFDVQTKSARSGVRGTEFVVQALSDGRSKFFVISGYVEVRGRTSLGPTVVLSQMQTSAVPLGGDPTFATVFLAEEIAKALEDLGEKLPAGAQPTLAQNQGASALSANAGANVIDEARAVKQSEWAKLLVEKLGITEEGLLSEEDFAALLAGGRSQSIEAEESKNKMEYLLRVEDAKASGGAYVEAKKLSGTLRFSTFSAREGKFPVKVVMKGKALVSVNDQTFVVESDPNESVLKQYELGQVDLRKGENFFNVVLSKGSSMDLVQIDSRCVDPIVPEGGWAMGEDLNFGQKAETLLQAMDQEGRLPLDSSFVAYLKGVNAYETKGEVEKIDLSTPEQNAPRPALKTPNRNAFARWRIKLPVSGIYSFSAQSAGGSPLAWTADGCEVGKNLPDQPEVPGGWQEFATKMLSEGEHIVEVSMPPGTVLEGLRITKRRGGGANALQALNDMGFQEGSMGESVSMAKAKENLRQSLLGGEGRGSILPGDEKLRKPGPEWGKPYIDEYPFPGGPPFIPPNPVSDPPVSPLFPTL